MASARCPQPAKLRHPSREMAESARKSTLDTTRDHPHRRAQLTVYQCRCGAWHVGHARTAARRRHE